MSLVGYIISRKSCVGKWAKYAWDKEYLYFLVSILFPSTDCSQGMGLYIILNSPHRQTAWYLSLSFSTATNSCSSPLPFLKNLALKQRKAKTKNWWSRLTKAGCQEKGVFQKIPNPQVPMFKYSHHIIPLVLVQFYFFCFTILCHIFYLLLQIKAQLLGTLST